MGEDDGERMEGNSGHAAAFTHVRPYSLSQLISIHFSRILFKKIFGCFSAYSNYSSSMLLLLTVQTTLLCVIAFPFLFFSLFELESRSVTQAGEETMVSAHSNLRLPGSRDPLPQVPK